MSVMAPRNRLPSLFQFTDGPSLPSAIDLIIRAFYTTAAQDRRNDLLTLAAHDRGGWFAVAGVPGLVAAQLLTGMGASSPFTLSLIWNH